MLLLTALIETTSKPLGIAKKGQRSKKCSVDSVSILHEQRGFNVS